MTFCEEVIVGSPENSSDYNMESVMIKGKKIESNNKKSPCIVIDNNQLFSITHENDEKNTSKPLPI